MIESTIPYNNNGSRRVSGEIVIGIGRSFSRVRHKKIHSRIYNSTTDKKSGGEQVNGFKFDDTINNQKSKLNKGKERIIN